MFGFLFGTMCLFGLVGVARRAAFAHGGGCHGGGWHGGRRGRRYGGRFQSEGFARAASEIFKRRLRIDEEQESMVDHAFIDLRKALNGLGEELKDSRKGIADAFRGETVDDAALASAFARHDDAIARARRDIVSSLKQVHAVLDPDQRAKASDWIASGPDAGWV